MRGQVWVVGCEVTAVSFFCTLEVTRGTYEGDTICPCYYHYHYVPLCPHRQMPSGYASIHGQERVVFLFFDLGDQFPCVTYSSVLRTSTLRAAAALLGCQEKEQETLWKLSNNSLEAGPPGRPLGGRDVCATHGVPRCTTVNINVNPKI